MVLSLEEESPSERTFLTWTRSCIASVHHSNCLHIPHLRVQTHRDCSYLVNRVPCLECYTAGTWFTQNPQGIKHAFLVCQSCDLTRRCPRQSDATKSSVGKIIRAHNLDIAFCVTVLEQTLLVAFPLASAALLSADVYVRYCQRPGYKVPYMGGTTK